MDPKITFFFFNMSLVPRALLHISGLTLCTFNYKTVNSKLT